MKQVDPGVMLRMSAALKMMGQADTDYKEAVVRRLVSPDNLTVSQGGRAYAGYGGNADFTMGNTVNRVASTGGTALGSLAAFPAFDAMRQALPMVQAVLLMAVYIMIPLILVFAAYEFKAVITVTFVVFALNFLTFWWELARWLLEALYGSDTHSRWNVAGFQNSSDDLIMNIVMGAMLIVLPTLWGTALGWAGIRAGALSEMISGGAKQAQNSGGKAVDVATNAVLQGGKK